MRRREFVTLLGGDAVWSLAAHAQSAKRIPLIGELVSYSTGSEEAKNIRRCP
jgi:hypothetical protein